MVIPLAEAVTFRPPAVSAASEPNFWFEDQEPEVVVQLSEAWRRRRAAVGCAPGVTLAI
jgi:hypothetical protein